MNENQTRHIIVQANELPKNIRNTINKELLNYECLSTLTIYQVNTLLNLIEQTSVLCLNYLISSEY
jgi:hypothetical protein